MKIEDLKFDEKGLIPAVVIDNRTNKVLTVAYMSRESLAISLEEREKRPAMCSISCVLIQIATVMR